MDQTRWEKINRILDVALSFDTLSQQKACIREKCGRRNKLMEDALQILNAIHEADDQGFLE